MSLYSIVIPVYKSTKSLEEIVDQISKLQANTSYDFELIFVNDSPFYLDTETTLEKLSSQNDFVKHLTLRKNMGQQFAVLCGLQRATGDFILTMDDDLQHPVKEIPNLIETFHSKPYLEAIFAIPNFKNRRHDLWRNVGSYVLNNVDSFFLNKPKGLYKSSFRIMTVSLTKAIVNNYNAMPAVSSLIIFATDKIENIEIEHNSRQYGKSNYTVKKLFNHTLNNLLHYSSLPLKALGFVGGLVFAFSMLFILFIVAKKLIIGTAFPGYSSTVSLISFFGGLNLFGIGLLGEYLIRILREQQKPKLEDLLK